MIDIKDHQIISIMKKIQKFNRNLICISDGFTGLFVYDSSRWNIIKEISIHRIENEENPPKCSNAYLLQDKNNSNICFWVVNIHLKAGGEGEDRFRRDELENIVNKIFQENSKKYRIYLCGDFNADLNERENKGFPYILSHIINNIQDKSDSSAPSGSLFGSVIFEERYF